MNFLSSVSPSASSLGRRGRAKGELWIFPRGRTAARADERRIDAADAELHGERAPHQPLARPTASANPTHVVPPSRRHRRSRASVSATPRGGTWAVTSNEPRRAHSLVVPRRRKEGDKDDRRGGGGAYPEYFLDMGPRIRKVFPDEPDFDPAAWDIICDVRSPSEWAEDHVPGSISAPVLDDEQRAGVEHIQARVTFSRQEGWRVARRARISLAKIVDEHFLHREKDTRGARVLLARRRTQLSLALP